MFRTQKLCLVSKISFDLRQNFFCFRLQQGLFPKHMFSARLDWETFASAWLNKETNLVVETLLRRQMFP